MIPHRSTRHPSAARAAFRIALVLLALGASTLPADPMVPEIGRPVEFAPARFNHRLTPTTTPIEIDGRIDPSEWRDALVLPVAYETRPGDNLAAPVKTTCWITFDEGTLYFAFRALDPEPQAIRANLADRDTPWDDDLVGIVLDTFNDERRAYEFLLNPLGVQIDQRTDESVGSEDASWNAIWQSAGRLTDEGFEVEAAIPFSSLRFPKTSGEQIWGFDAARFYPRSEGRRFNLQPLDRGVSCFVCQLSKLTGLGGVTPGRNLEINPTATASRTDSRPAFPSGDLVDGDEDGDAGLTVRWGITPNWNLSGTLNPDFSQVEADAAQLDINNQFALFFPERRPFFLEGADTFDTPIQAVFTRNVADPDWGLKLVGRQGRNDLGLFVAEDARTNLLLPGNQQSRTAQLDRSSTATVGRFRRDIGEASSLGALVTRREAGGYHNEVYGIDGQIRFSDADILRFQGLLSDTRYPRELALREGLSQDTLRDHAFTVSYNHDSRNLGLYSSYRRFGEDFRADLGFLPRVGYDFLLGGVEYTWWGDDKPWTRIKAGGDWDLTRDEDGNELERELEGWFEIAGPLQSFGLVRGGVRDRFFDGQTFEENYVFFFGEMVPTARTRFEVFVEVGDQIDFANTRLGEQIRWEIESGLKLGRKLSLELAHEERTLDVEGGELFTARLTQLRSVYQFSVRSFLRAVLQRTSIDRNPALYDDPVDAESDDLFSQLLFSYKLNPRTVFFLGYSDNRTGDERIDLTVRDRTFFLKIGYAWVL